MLGYSLKDRGFHEKNSEITARAASIAVEQILNKYHKGKVHSVFNNSLNLQIGERLVHIGPLDNGLAPFGVGLSQNDAQKLLGIARREQQVTWNASAKCFVFTGGRTVSLKQVKWTNHLLQKSRFDAVILTNNRKLLANRMNETKWETGLAQTADDQKRIMDYLSESSQKWNHPIINKMAELISLTRDEKQIISEAVFNYWIGRGIGLTPSGDDVLTGMCAALSVLGGLTTCFQEQLKTYLLEKGLKRTTPIGYEYLYYAVEKHYHTHLLEMCMALIKRQKTDLLTALEAMKKIGHTSGADTMIGVLLGIKAMNPE